MRYRVHPIIKASLFTAACAAAALLPREAAAAPNTHDGFYLQLATGLGYLSASADEPFDQTLSGVSLPSSLMLGGSIVPGIVLGGGFQSDYAPAPSLESNGQDSTLDFTMYLISIGALVDVYPDPHGGLHFSGFVGWGGLETSVEGNAGGSDPTGLALYVGGGYDWWVGREWSIGILGRIGYAPLSLDDVSYTTIAPAVLATFTYH